MVQSGVSRASLLVGGEFVPDWMANALTKMVEETDTQINLVVIAKQPNKESPSDSRNWFFSRLATTLQQIFPNRNPSESVHLSEIPVIKDPKIIACECMSHDDVGVELPSDIVELVARSSEVVIHSGVGILQGDILSATDYGVLSFHHGDLRKYRGTPAGFWEFMNDEHYVGITVQKLTEELDAGYVVAYDTVDISGARTWKEVRKKIYDNSEPMLADAVTALSNPANQSYKIPQENLGRLYYSSEFDLRAKIRSRIKELKNMLAYFAPF